MNCTRVLIVAVPLLAITFAGYLAPGAADYVKQRAETSPQSRWYTLSELGIPSFAAAIREATMGPAAISDNNGQAIDLSVLSDVGTLAISESASIANSESWEGGIESGRDRVGYPSVVRNTAGRNPDGRFYLYYSIHDPYSGIAVAIADEPGGLFQKLSDMEPWRQDSRVLRAPRRPRQTSHFAAPVVVWNPDERLWFMYFHYYVNDWSTGGGHQKTALATSPDLSSHRWTVSTDREGRIIAVLPVSRERWMNSQSTYHTIQRFRSGLWIAFLRGVGGQYDAKGEWHQDVGKLGFAVSRDGRRWMEAPGNPIIHAGDRQGGKTGVYRPLFLAKSGSELLLAWSESDFYDSNPRLMFGLTRDLRTVTRIAAPLPAWTLSDGPASLWLQGQTLYVYQGSNIAIMHPAGSR